MGIRIHVRQGGTTRLDDGSGAWCLARPWAERGPRTHGPTDHELTRRAGVSTLLSMRKLAYTVMRPCQSDRTRLVWARPRCPLWLTVVVVCFVWLAGCQTGPSPAEQRAQEHYQSGQVFLEDGLTSSALAAFGLAIEENPRLIEAHMGMGHIYRERDDFSKAKRSYRNAADIEPTSFDAQYHLGLMHQLLGEMPQAVRAYLLALAVDADDFAANQNLAAAYLQTGKPAEAIPYAQRAAQIQPDHQGAWSNLATAYRLAGEYDLAVQAYREALELGDLQQPILIGLASSHLRLGNFDRAINVLRAMVRVEPSAEAYERLGFAYFKQKKYQLALEQFRSALSLDENDVASLNGLGVCLMTRYLQGNRQNKAQQREAIQLWQKSISLRPEQPRIIDLITRYQSY